MKTFGNTPITLVLMLMDPDRDSCIKVFDLSKIMGGVIKHPAIAYPEVACPLGVYYPYPKTGATTTAFGAFTGNGVEPLDKANRFVDMNHNGVWDRRETVNTARQKSDRRVYVSCVKQAAGRLQKEGFSAPPP